MEPMGQFNLQDASGPDATTATGQTQGNLYTVAAHQTVHKHHARLGVHEPETFSVLRSATLHCAQPLDTQWKARWKTKWWTVRHMGDTANIKIKDAANSAHLSSRRRLHGNPETQEGLTVCFSFRHSSLNKQRTEMLGGRTTNFSHMARIGKASENWSSN